MRRMRLFAHGSVAPLALVAGVFVSILALSGVMFSREVEMRLEPERVLAVSGDTLEMRVFVSAPVPVNVFSGELRFDSRVLSVESIDYNTSIADVWIEKPWYENGAGTLNFGGGTTVRGGFTGDGVLLTVRFKARREGAGFVQLHHARILLHDGLGTDAEVRLPLDSIVTIAGVPNLLAEASSTATFSVLPVRPSTDLDGDGRQTFADVRIFLFSMAGGGQHLDFNGDGAVNLADLSILFEVR